MPFENLDLKCAKIAEDAAEKLKDSDQKLVADASSILPKQGPYALTLYLASKKQHHLLGQVGEILKLAHPKPDAKTPSVLAKEVATEPARLLLARRLLLQFFAYLKYLLKAKAPEEDKTKDTQ